MALRNLNSALKAALLKDDEFILAHLIKFEKPKQGSSTSTNAVDYVYMTDAPFPLTLDDQLYIPSNIMNIGMVRENIEAKASTMSIKIAASALGTSFVDDITFTASYIQIPDSWSVLGFKEGDVITFTPGSGTGHSNSDLEFRIDSISESAEGKEDRVHGTVVSGTLSAETKNYKVSTDNPQLNSLLIDRTSDGYATYIHREITVYRAYLDPQTGAYIGNADKELYDTDGEPISNPFILFKGNIANANLVENATSGSAVTWSITDHWGDFVRINGRQTSDASHRSLDSSGRPVVAHLPNPLYEDDYAFEHAEKSLNAMATYIRQEQRTTKKWGKWAKKLTGGKKTVTYWADVPVPVELNFNLAAKYIPVVYGMSKVKGNTFFIDTGKDDSTTEVDENTYVYQAQALCEGPIAGIYDIHIQGDTVLCTDNVDYSRRQPEEDTEAGDELPICYGNAKAGKIISGYNTISFSDVDRFDILSTPEEDAELVNRSAKLDTAGRSRLRFFGGGDKPANEPANPTVLTSSAYKGVGANQSIRLLKPNEIIFDVFTGTSDQRASDRLATISAQGGFKIQNDFYRGAEGNYSPYYWTTSHRALDTAYVVSRTTLAANASSLPEVEYVVKGKFINCYNYDGSLSPYSGESEIATWKRYDAVDVYDLDDNKLNSGVHRIAETFEIDKLKAQQVKAANQSGVGTQRRFLVHDTARLLADIGEEKQVYFKKSGATEKVYCTTYRASVKRGTSSTITATPISSMTTTNFKSTARRRNGRYWTNGDSENSFSVTYSSSSANAAVGDEMASNSTTYYPFTFKKPNSNDVFNTTIMCKSSTRTLSGGTYTHKFIVDYWPSAETFKKIEANGGAAFFTNFVSVGSQDVSDIEAGQVISLSIPNKPDRVISVEKVITTSSSNKLLQLNENAKRLEDTATVTAFEDDILNDLRVSLNPSIQLLDFLTSKRYGKGLDIDTDIDIASFLQAARDCDERSEVSIIVAGTTTTSNVGIGSLWKREYSSNITFTGKVKRLTPVQFEGSNYTQIDFEDCTGKFVRRWKPYASYGVGDIVYDGEAIYRVNTAFTVGSSFDDTDSDSHDDLKNNSTEIWHEAEDESGNLTSASLSKISGSGASTILYPYVEDDPSHKAQGPIANPVIRAWNGRDFSAPGYSLYDCDDIDYWALQGWNDANQYNVTRHQCSMNIDTSESLFDSVNLMLKQFNGLLTYTNGKYSLSVKKAVPDTLDTIVVDTTTYTPAQIHKDDIIGELKIEGKAVKDTFNTVTTRVSDPAQKFNNTDITFFDSTYIEQDRGIPKSANIAYPGIINYYNARINIKQELDRSRAGLTISFTTKPSAILLKAGDFVQLTHPEFGFTNKTFRITSLSLKSDGLVTIAAQEHDSSTYILKGLDRGTELIATNDNSGRLPARVGAPPVLATTTNDQNETVLDLPNIVTSLPQQMIIKWTHTDTYDPSTYAVEVWRNDEATDDVIANATKLGSSHGTEFLDSHGQEDDGFNFYYYLRYIVTGTKVNASEPSRMYSDFTQVIEADMTPLNAEYVKYTGTGTPTIQSLMPNEAGADNTSSQVNDGVTIDGAGGGFILDSNGHIKSNGRLSEQVNSAGEAGFFLGYNADALEDENGDAQGAYTFGVGDQTNNLIWDGEELTVTGNIDATTMTLADSIEIGASNLDDAVNASLDLADSAVQSTSGLALLLNQNAAGTANQGEAALVAVDSDGAARHDVDGFIEWDGSKVTVPHDTHSNTTILTDVAGKKGFIAFDVNKSKPFNVHNTTTNVAFVYKQGDQWYYDNNGATESGIVEWAPGTLMGTESGTTSTPARILAIGYLQTSSSANDSIIKGGLFGAPIDIELASMPSDDINSGTIAGIKVTHNSIESTNFSTGAQGNGFKIASDGTMEASSGTFRGNLDASTLTLDESITIGSTNLPSDIVSGAAAGATALAEAREMAGNTDNLVKTPVFNEFDDQGGWSSSETDIVELDEESDDVTFTNGFDYALKLSHSTLPIALETTNIIPVNGGETIYFSAWVNAEYANQDVSIGYRKYTAGVVTNIYVKAATLTAGTAGWKLLSGVVDLPDDTISAIQPWIEINWESGDAGTPGVAYFNAIRISRSAQGNIGGITINSNKLYQGTGQFENANTGFYLDNSGNFSLQDKLKFDADGGDDEGEGKLTIKGDIEADTLTLASGISIGTGNLASDVLDSLAKADNIPANQFSARRSWEFDIGTQGWSPITHASIDHGGSGIITVTSSGNDPTFQSPDNLNFDGGRDHLVVVRFKRTAGTGWQGTLYYATHGTDSYTAHGYHEDYKKNISDPTNGESGAYVVATWDMSDLTNGDDDWVDNDIKRIRFDLGNASGDKFEIDWIAIGSIGSAGLRDGADLQSGTVGGTVIDTTKIYQGEGNHNNSDTGFYLDNAGNFSIQDKLSFNGTDLTVSGDITAENLTLEADATVTGTLSADNIAIDDVMLDTVDGDLILKREGIGASRFATDAKLLMNPVSQTGNVYRWGGYDDYGNVVNTINDETTVSYDSTEKALKLATTNDNQAIRCESWPVNPNNIYKITFSIKSSANQGLWYVGATQSSTLIESQTMNSGHNGQTNMIFPAWYNYNRTEYTTNSDGSTTGNFYFRSGSSTSYIEMSVYMLGNNVSIDDVPQHVGSGGNPYVKLNADAKFAGLRILNWDNDDSPKDVFVKNLSVTEVTPFPIVAQNIETANLSAISSDLGSITAGSLAIGDNDEFEVTSAGALTATGATISGAITATSGSFTGTVNASSGSFTGSIDATSLTISQPTTPSVPSGMNVPDGETTVVMTKDQEASGNTNIGEIRLQPGYFRLARDVKREVSSNLRVITPYEGSITPPGDTFYIISGEGRAWGNNTDSDDTNNGRFHGGTDTASINEASNLQGFFVAKYENSNWKAVNNNNQSITFTPESTDYCIAVGTKTTNTAGSGIDTLVQTQRNGTFILPDNTTDDINAGVTIESGGITMSSGGFIKGGQSGFDAGSDGFFLGYDTDAYKFSIGDVDGDKLTWDGTDLAVTGEITATSGTFTGAVNASSGTFTGNVSTTAKFTAGNVGLDGTSGDADTIRIFAGHSTPSSALFKVTDGGAVTATSGTIGSLTLASDKVTIGTSTTHGNANAKFYADDSGNFGLGDKLSFDGTNLSVNGAVTATSGSFGGITIANSKIYTGDGNFGNSNTGFYLDNTGDFSLSNKFKFDISASTLTVDGTIEADEFSMLEGKPVPEITVGTKLQSQATLSPRVVIFGEDPVFYSALEDNTRIYLNNELVATVNKGASSTIAAADLDKGDIIHSTKPVSLRQNGSPLPTLAATGQFFVTTNRPDYQYLHFGIYSPYADGQIKYFNFDSANPVDGSSNSLIDWSDSNAYDASTNTDGWKTLSLTQGSVKELTIERVSSTVQGYQWFQADTPVVITSAASTSNTWFGGELRDVKLLKEVSREVLSYDEGAQIKYNPSATGTIENTNHGTATSWRYSRSTGGMLFAHSDQGDGDGGDGVQGIPWKMCGDTYVIDHGLRGYQIATIEPSVISAYYWTGSAWTLYKTHDFTDASRESFAAHSEGDSDDHGVDSNSFIGQGVADKPWRFIGTGRFALRVNTPSTGWNTDGYDDDEYFVLGYDSNLRSQETIRVGQLIAEDISADAITGEKILSTTNIKVGPAGSEQVGLDGSGTGDSAVRIYAGDTTPGSAPFRVTDDGSLTATGATISGEITATSLTIGESATVSGLSSTDVSGLGTAATTDATAYATASQGTKADNALVASTYNNAITGFQIPTKDVVIDGFDDSEWVVGNVTNNVGKWSAMVGQNGENESSIAIETGPHGIPAKVWTGVSYDIGSPEGSNRDGGFDIKDSERITITNNRVYRFTVFVKKNGTDGSFYFGGHNYNSSGTNIGFPYHNLNSLSNTNQYWYSGTDLPTQDEWYLLAGYIQPQKTVDGTQVAGVNSGLSGAYKLSDGTKHGFSSDLMFHKDAAKFSVRVFNDSASSTTGGAEVNYAHPRIEIVDENTPSIEQLIAGAKFDPNAGVPTALQTINVANGSTNIEIIPNETQPTGQSYADGEFRIGTGTLKLNNETDRVNNTAATLSGPYEGGLLPPYKGNNFYLISGATTPYGSGNRFTTLSGTNNGINLFVGIYDPVNAQWYAVDNNNKAEAFTPLDTDYVVAEAHKTSSSGGIDRFSMLTSVVNDPDSDQTEPTLTAGVSITGGGITVNGGGSVKGGQTAYNSGTGFFLGYDTNNYKFSIGNSGADQNSLTWDGSDLTIRGDITADSLTLSSGVTIGTGSLSGTISDTNLPSTALNENVTASSLNISNTDVSGLGTAATTDSTAYATAAQGDTADSASQVNAGLALITNKHKNNDDTLVDNNGEALLVGVDKTGTPIATQNGFIQWEGSKITIETEQYNSGGGLIATILTGSPGKKGFIIFDTAKGNPFTVHSTAMDVAFAWKIGTQWYYDNNGDNAGTELTLASSYVALGYLETTTSDLITKGGLFGHPVPLDQAAFPGDVVQSGTIGGIKIDNEKIYAGNGTFNTANTGFYLKSDGDFSLKNLLSFDASQNELNVNGHITAASLTLDSSVTIGTENLDKQTVADSSLNLDPYFLGNINNWYGADDNASTLASRTWSTFETSATPLPSKRFSYVELEDNTDSSRNIFSEYIPIESGKAYKVTYRVRQTAGNRRNYLLVDFRNSSGSKINNSSNPTASSAGSSNWTAIGTYHYNNVSNSTFPGDWTTYETTFGGTHDRTIPNGAVKFAVGGLFVRSAPDGVTGTNSIVQIAEISVQEIDSDAVNAGVTDIGGITVTNDKLYHGGGVFNSSGTGFYLDSGGNFSLSNKLSFDGDELTVGGIIKGDGIIAGTIEGSSIKSNTLIEAYSTDSNDEIIETTYAALDGTDDTYRIYAGSSVPDSAPFSVQANGSVVARDLRLFTSEGELYFDSTQGFGDAALSQVAAYLGERVHQFSKPFITGTGHGSSVDHTNGYADTNDYREWEKVTTVETTSVTVTAKIDTSSMYGYGAHVQYDSLYGYRGTGYLQHFIGGWENTSTGATGTGITNHMNGAEPTESWPTSNVTLSTNNFVRDIYAPGGTGSSFPAEGSRDSTPVGDEVSFYHNELIKLHFADLPSGSITITGVTGARYAPNGGTSAYPFTNTNNTITRFGDNNEGILWIRIHQNGSDTFGFTINTPAGYGNITYSGGVIGSNRVDILTPAYNAIPEYIYITVNRRLANGNSTPTRVIDHDLAGYGTQASSGALRLKKASLENSTNANYTAAAGEFVPVVESSDGSTPVLHTGDGSFNDTYFGHTVGSGDVRFGIKTDEGVVDASGYAIVQSSAAALTADEYYFDVQLSNSTPGPQAYDWMSFDTVDSCTLLWSAPTTSAGFALEDGQATQADDIPANKLVYGSTDRVTNTASLVKVLSVDLQVDNDIRCYGDVTAFYSDERFKTRTRIIDSALEKVKSLEGFFYKENELANSFGYDSGKEMVGLSAQQVQKILPEAVTLAPVDMETLEDGSTVSKSGENYLTVDYSKLVPLLVEAMKDQQKQIEDLTEKLEKLEK